MNEETTQTPAATPPPDPEMKQLSLAAARYREGLRLGLRDVAILLGVTVRTIQRHIDDGRFPPADFAEASRKGGRKRCWWRAETIRRHELGLARRGGAA